MDIRRVTLSISSLFIVCVACVQTHAAQKPANPNVAPRATVTANSELSVGRKYLARCVVDGKIPVENQAFADDGLNGRRSLRTRA